MRSHPSIFSPFTAKMFEILGHFRLQLEQLLASPTGFGMQIEHDEGVAPKPRKLLNVLYSPVAIQEVQFQWANTSLWNHIYFKVFKNTGSAFMDLYFALQGAGEFFPLLISQLRRRRKTLDWMWWPETLHVEKHNVLSAAQNQISKEVKRLEKDRLVWNIKVLFSITKLSFWQKRGKGRPEAPKVRNKWETLQDS